MSGISSSGNSVRQRPSDPELSVGPSTVTPRFEKGGDVRHDLRPVLATAAFSRSDPVSSYAGESPPPFVRMFGVPSVAGSDTVEVSAESIFDRLEPLLPSVQKPIQYVG